MYLCEECDANPVNHMIQVFGDGSCDKHGRFATYQRHLIVHCQQCADEKEKEDILSKYDNLV